MWRRETRLRVDFVDEFAASRAGMAAAADAVTDVNNSRMYDGLAAYEQLLKKLADVPTPAGPTPRQLTGGHLVQLQAGGYVTRANHR